MRASMYTYGSRGKGTYVRMNGRAQRLARCTCAHPSNYKPVQTCALKPQGHVWADAVEAAQSAADELCHQTTVRVRLCVLAPLVRLFHLFSYSS